MEETSAPWEERERRKVEIDWLGGDDVPSPSFSRVHFLTSLHRHGATDPRGRSCCRGGASLSPPSSLPLILALSLFLSCNFDFFLVVCIDGSAAPRRSVCYFGGLFLSVIFVCCYPAIVFRSCRASAFLWRSFVDWTFKIWRSGVKMWRKTFGGFSILICFFCVFVFDGFSLWVLVSFRIDFN